MVRWLSYNLQWGWIVRLNIRMNEWLIRVYQYQQTRGYSSLLETRLNQLESDVARWKIQLRYGV